MSSAAPGERIGRYQLVRLLGRGAMGEVWEAVLHGPHGFRRPIALKLLSAGPGDPHQRRSLINEARLGALLSHPNVVATHDLGEVDGRWYVAMELVRGTSVAALVRSGPLPPLAIIEIGLQTCEALTHLHGLEVEGRRAGLVHRDVKPQNLLVDRLGVVKLCDLGIARLTGTGGLAAGTSGYMAPEQLQGREEPRSDLFAVGATLVAIAAGDPPPGLGAIVARCMEPSPADRWPTAAALGAALEALRSELPRGTSLVQHVRGRGRGAPPVTHPIETSLRPDVGAVADPQSHDRFVGRDAERADLLARIREPGVVVLQGPAGMGKTRLALEVAIAADATLPGGAWFCSLAEATTGDAVLNAVATTLEVRLAATDPEGQLGRAVAARGRVLVVLDNAEQAVDALREPLERWVTLAPEACFVVTTRVALGRPAQLVGPLDPDAGLALFLDRAPRRPSAADLPSVREIITRLDGMPLAIELAAARTRALTPQQILERLDDRFQLLTQVAGTSSARHRSLRASLDGSWELLRPWEQDTLAQLSVFSGGFELTAAEAVVDLSAHPDAPWVLDVLDALAAGSLVTVDGERFTLLESVRAYAADRLEPGRAGPLSVRHGAHYARGALNRPVRGRAAWRAYPAELGNLVTALRAAVARGDGDVAAATCEAACEILMHSGPQRAAVELADTVLALPSLGPVQRSTLLWVSGHAWSNAGAADLATARIEAAVSAARTAGDPGALRRSLIQLATLHHEHGKLDDADADLREALLLAAGDPLEEAEALSTQAIVDVSRGRLDDARRHHDVCIATFRLHDRPVSEALALGNLASLLIDLGDYDIAKVHLRRALSLSELSGNLRQAASSLRLLGIIEDDQGHCDAAAALFEQALTAARRLGDRRQETRILSDLGIVAFQAGRFDDSEATLIACIASAREMREPLFEGIAASNLADLRLEQHRPLEARTFAETALRLHEGMGHRSWAAVDRGILAAVDLATGDPAGAVVRAQEALVTLDALFPLAAACSRVVLAEALARSGQDGAQATVDRAIEALRVARSPAQLVRALLAKARIADPASAITALAEAEALAVGLPSAGPAVRDLDRTRSTLR